MYHVHLLRCAECLCCLLLSSVAVFLSDRNAHLPVETSFTGAAGFSARDLVVLLIECSCVSFTSGCGSLAFERVTWAEQVARVQVDIVGTTCSTFTFWFLVAELLTVPARVTSTSDFGFSMAVGGGSTICVSIFFVLDLVL